MKLTLVFIVSILIPFMTYSQDSLKMIALFEDSLYNGAQIVVNGDTLTLLNKTSIKKASTKIIEGRESVGKYKISQYNLFECEKTSKSYLSMYNRKSKFSEAQNIAYNALDSVNILNVELYNDANSKFTKLKKRYNRLLKPYIGVGVLYIEPKAYINIEGGIVLSNKHQVGVLYGIALKGSTNVLSIKYNYILNW